MLQINTRQLYFHICQKEKNYFQMWKNDALIKMIHKCKKISKTYSRFDQSNEETWIHREI